MSSIHFYDPTAAFERLFDDALAPRLCPSAYAASTGAHGTPRQRDACRPRLDLHESEDTNTVTATFELPGLTSENIAIDVHQNHLTVSGEFSNSESQEETGYVIRERRSGKFTRKLQLPFGTKADDVNAKMENGVLTITFPKTSPEQQAKRVPIQ